MTAGAVLVTGGAGYIGSHAVRQFLAAGYRVVVLDNLSTGFRWAVAPEAAFVEGDAGDAPLVGKLIAEHGVKAVVHFAGSLIVPESVEQPLKYYGNNTAVSRNLIQACVEKGIERFVFSSTAAVYGTPEKLPVAETAEPRPINPYGRSKLVTEWMLRDASASPAGRGLKHVILRYFNVAGASLDGTLGQATRGATHLIKVACEAA
ncbi:MAG: NAD-dependent epimerase/dehydratase family protein, partial [Burkholderiales bacterium]